MKKAPKAKKPSSKTRRKSTAAQKQGKLDKLNLSEGKLEVEKVRELEELLGVSQMNALRPTILKFFRIILQKCL